MYKKIYITKINQENASINSSRTNIIFFLVFLFIIIYFLFTKEVKKENFLKLFSKTIEMDAFEEKIKIQNYIDLVFNGTNIYKDKIYKFSNNPKISIVISVYNGEAYLRTALLSIQNQDFKDLEIIMVDDGSKDNSIDLIKELKKTEPRIILLENGENRGPLYTKTKGVLHSKGKYVMTMDEDDIYVQKDAFSSLYFEAEKNNLDILGFIYKYSGSKVDARKFNYPKDKSKVFYQPKIGNLLFHLESNGTVKLSGGSLVNLFIKTSLFKKIIGQIKMKYLNQKMYFNDDYIIYFLLTRNAYNMKFVSRIFYLCLKTWDINEPKVKFRTIIKNQDRNNRKCFGYLIFLEMLFELTKNTIRDKNIAFSQLDHWYLQKKICRNNKITKDKALKVFNLYLKSVYIRKENKKKIQDFINDMKYF